MTGKLRVISANRLRDGSVVYVDERGRWVEGFAEAAAFEDDASFEAALLRAKEDERANLVLDIVPVDALRIGSSVRPAHLREMIRAKGPTVRLDHGKQAGGHRLRGP